MLQVSIRRDERTDGEKKHSVMKTLSKGTYRKPVAKIAVMKSFLLIAICNFHRAGIGRIKIAKSVITLNIEVPKYAAPVLKQCPDIINGFQIFSCGIHCVMANIVETEYMMKQLQIQK